VFKELVARRAGQSEEAGASDESPTAKKG
jgi:hypothetical protein